MLIRIVTLHFCSCITINSYKSHFVWSQDQLLHGYLYHYAMRVVYTNTTHHCNSKAAHISAVHIVHKTCLAAFPEHKNTDYGLLGDFNGSAGVQAGILAKEHIYTKLYFPLSVSHVILNAATQSRMIQIRRELFHTPSSNISAIDEFRKQNPCSTQTVMFDNGFQGLSCGMCIKELEML